PALPLPLRRPPPLQRQCHAQRAHLRRQPHRGRQRQRLLRRLLRPRRLHSPRRSSLTRQETAQTRIGLMAAAMTGTAYAHFEPRSNRPTLSPMNQASSSILRVTARTQSGLLPHFRRSQAISESTGTASQVLAPTPTSLIW